MSEEHCCNVGDIRRLGGLTGFKDYWFCKQCGRQWHLSMDKLLEGEPFWKPLEWPWIPGMIHFAAEDRYMNGAKCDVWSGPCACGAWHTPRGLMSLTSLSESKAQEK